MKVKIKKKKREIKGKTHICFHKLLATDELALR